MTSRGGRFDFFAGTGVTWLRPRFEVGFTNLDGFVDNTQIEVNLQRWSLLGGATLHLPASFAITGEVSHLGVDIGWHRDPTRIETIRDQLCAMERWGQKKGAGFYDYASGKPVPMDRK